MTEENVVELRSATEANEKLLQQQIEKATKEIKEREEKNFRDGCAVYVLQGIVQGYAWYFRKTAEGAEAGCDREIALPALARLTFDMADAMLEERKRRNGRDKMLESRFNQIERIMDEAKAEGIDVYIDADTWSMSPEEYIRAFKEALRLAAEANPGTAFGARWIRHFQRQEAAFERTGGDGKTQEAKETEGTEPAASQHQS